MVLFFPCLSLIGHGPDCAVFSCLPFRSLTFAVATAVTSPPCCAAGPMAGPMVGPHCCRRAGRTSAWRWRRRRAGWCATGRGRRRTPVKRTAHQLFTDFPCVFHRRPLPLRVCFTAVHCLSVCVSLPSTAFLCVLHCLSLPLRVCFTAFHCLSLPFLVCVYCLSPPFTACRCYSKAAPRVSPGFAQPVLHHINMVSPSPEHVGTI